MTSEFKTYTLKGKVRYCNILTPKSFDTATGKQVYDPIGSFNLTMLLTINEENNIALKALKNITDNLYLTCKNKENPTIVKPHIPIQKVTIDDTKYYQVKMKRNAINQKGIAAIIYTYNKDKEKIILEKEPYKNTEIIARFSIADSQRVSEDNEINHFCTFYLMSMQIIKLVYRKDDTSWCMSAEEQAELDIDNEIPF